MSRDRWRRQWVLIITLLRMVGHVLAKVDGASGPRMRKAIDTAFAALKQAKPPHWEFVEDERNCVLKQYGIGWSEHPLHLRVEAVHEGRKSDPVKLTVFVSKIDAGPFAGKQPLVVVEEVAEWWEKYLDGIDAAG